MSPPGDIKANYKSALLEFMTASSERTLDRAYEMGRQALGDGMGILDIVEVHHGALAEHLLDHQQDALRTAMTVESARRFLLEVFAAFEMANRGYRDANRVLRHFNEVLEGEMKRVAQFLHDNTGQLIAAIHLELEMVRSQADRTLAHRLQTIRQLLTQVEDQVRRVAREMRPPVLDDLGLVPALEFLRGEFERRSKLKILVQGPQDQRFPEAVEISVYRVVQEALSNVIRHAKASKVVIRLETTGGRLLCSVRDDGVGFDTTSRVPRQTSSGFGLLGMKQRLQRIGGEFDLHSAPGQGTEVCLSIPLR
ncbi:MAG TPA: ATP-binding protein [Planctomycetota bacterium]